MKLTGTDAQIKLAKDLLNQLVDEKRIAKLEKYGVDKLPPRQKARYLAMIEGRDAISTIDSSASKVISLVKNYNAGSNDTVVELINKINSK